MALPPISGQAIQPRTQSSAQPARSVDDARAAQRAFFQAALNKAQGTAMTQAVEKPVAVAQRPTAQAQTAPAPAASSDTAPSRLARPGSLLNIVV